MTGDGSLNSDLLRLLTLQDANTRYVLLGATVLGIAAGVIGCFAVLRRRALAGDALAHASLPGVCLSYLIIGHRTLPLLLLGALVAGVLAVLTIAGLRRATRVKEDAILGVVLTAFFGAGVVLSRIIQNQPGGDRAGLDTFLLGRAASMVRQDVTLILIVAAAVVISTLALYRGFKLICFDREFAAAIGWHVWLLDIALMLLVAMVTVIGLPAVGVVLVVALLIIPAAAARLWTQRLPRMLLTAALFGAASAVIGVSVSALRPNLAAGPLVALSAAAIFVLSMMLAPSRGVLPEWLRRARLRAKIRVENLLRAVYELGERSGAFSIPRAQLALKRAWSDAQLEAAVRAARRRGWLEPGEQVITLSAAGRERAVEVVRAHRLWELYLIEGVSVAPDHVDRDADALEHLLPPAILAQLESRLAQQGRLPVPVPSSPHTVEPHGRADPLA